MGCSAGVPAHLQGLLAGVLVLPPCWLPLCSATSWEIKVCSLQHPNHQCEECPSLDAQPVKPAGICDYYSDTSSAIWFCSENGTMVFQRVFKNANCMGKGHSSRRLPSGRCNPVDGASGSYDKYTCVSGTAWSWTAPPSLESSTRATTTTTLTWAAVQAARGQSSGNETPCASTTQWAADASTTKWAVHAVPVAKRNEARRIWLPASLAAAGVTVAAAAAGGITAAVMHHKEAHARSGISTTLRSQGGSAMPGHALRARSNTNALKSNAHESWQLLGFLAIFLICCVMLALLSSTQMGRALSSRIQRPTSSRQYQCALGDDDMKVESVSESPEADKRWLVRLPPLLPQRVPIVDSVPVHRSSPAVAHLVAGAPALTSHFTRQVPMMVTVSSS